MHGFLTIIYMYFHEFVIVLVRHVHCDVWVCDNERLFLYRCAYIAFGTVCLEIYSVSGVQRGVRNNLLLLIFSRVNCPFVLLISLSKGGSVWGRFNPGTKVFKVGF